MPLSIFADALPFSEMEKEYRNWFQCQKIAPMIPNVAYSSSLHWQLYLDRYPDERGAFVDWVKIPEKRKSVKFLGKTLSFLDTFGDLGLYARKVLNKYVYRKNVFANIPFGERHKFQERGKYLFWNEKTYRQESLFDNFLVISQDEGHISFDLACQKLNTAIESGEKNIFFVTGFADEIGHKSRRGEIYSDRIKAPMAKLHDLIEKYLEKNPDEEVLIVSDHGMSTINEKVDVGLKEKFGKKGYTAYKDSCIMCVWAEGDLKEKIKAHLESFSFGHVMTEVEREYYKVTDRLFGDVIFILREGYVFSDNWFGKSVKRPSGDGAGMHGFWPEWEAKDQIASVILINGKRELLDRYTYREANGLIKAVMGDK